MTLIDKDIENEIIRRFYENMPIPLIARSLSLRTRQVIRFLRRSLKYIAP